MSLATRGARSTSACCGAAHMQRAPTLPLVGRVASVASGVGVVVVARDGPNNSDPHPQPLPTRGRGADRVRVAASSQVASFIYTAPRCLIVEESQPDESSVRRRHRLRSSSGDAGRAGAAAVSRRVLARPARQPPHRQIFLHPHELSAACAAQRTSGLAAGVGTSGRRPRHDPPPRARSLRQPLRHLQRAARRARAVQRGHGGGAVRGGQRLDRKGAARPRAPPARIDPRARAQPGAGGQRDRARRARPPLRAGAAAGDGRDAAGAQALLADLRRGRAARACGGHPCRQHLSPRADAVGLAGAPGGGLRRAIDRVRSPSC